MAAAAFDLAERFQTPVLVLSDLDIGMNDWMIPKLTWNDDFRPDRGKVLTAEEFEAGKSFFRYLDVDGDGVPYRTYPGVHPKASYFTRGSGHNKYGAYTEDAEEYREVLDRIARKVNSASAVAPAPYIRRAKGAKYGLVTIGACHAACLEAMDKMTAEGLAVDYMRVRSFPFAKEVSEFLNEHELNFVVEQNRDGQLRSMLILETQIDPSRLESVRYYSGFPMSAHHVRSGVTEKLGVKV
jgi:2-oxoglutarate ferredoxin oxidoreductase subunit alpha